MGKDNNSRPENNMYICTLSGMFEEMVERGKRYNQFNVYS